MDEEDEPAPATPKGSAARIYDLVDGHPYGHFMLSEINAAVASFLLYAVFHMAAYWTGGLQEAFPLKNGAAAAHVDAVLTWGSAYSLSCTFSAFTVYQVLILFKRLWKDLGS